MGCDIHMFSERKPQRPAMDEDKEVWENCDLFTMNKYFERDNEEGESQFNVVEVCGGRNYDLFGVLANVRNERDNNFICEPKGIPSDCCAYIMEQQEYWGGDGHSHSWLTLAELKEYRKNQKETKYSGFMSPDDAARVDAGEMPKFWWHGGNAPSQIFRKWESQRDTLKGLIEAMEQRKEEVFRYDNRSNEKKDLEYRIVFWFDN